MKRRIFNYDSFVKKYSKDEEKGDYIKSYDEMIHIGTGSTIEDHPFYRDYLSKFNTSFELVTPEDVVMSPQEWDLLTRLIMGSFSSSYILMIDDEWKKNPTDEIKVRIRVLTKSGDNYVARFVDELFSFQIKRLFEIYVCEQIELLMLQKKREREIELHNTSFSDFDGDDENDIKQIKEEKCRVCDNKISQIVSEADFYKKINGFIKQ